MNNSIIKAFELLHHFTPQKKEWGVRELAAEIGANKSTIYRLLATLERLEVLKKDRDTGKYSLGLKLFELGNRVDVQHAFVHKTHPALEKVAENITETVHLGILKNNQVLMLDKVESPQGLQLHSIIGAYSPVYCTSLGKMLLAHLDEPTQMAILNKTPLLPKTKYTITDIPTLITELQQIRQQDYAIDREELELGLICLAVPVFNQNGKMIAALSAAGPANRFREELLLDYVEILTAGATQIRERVGGFVP